MDLERTRALKHYIKSLKMKVNDLKIWNQALTHKSYSNENKLKYNNETLEYLGDSVLELVVNEFLFREYPNFRENKFSKIKSYIVSKKNLVRYAQLIKIDSVLLLGKGELNTKGLEKESNLANAFEAIIGASYLDQGLTEVSKFILGMVKPQIKALASDKIEFDYKSQLQEFVQKIYKNRPVYKLVEAKGPDHNKTFLIEVFINDKSYGTGEGQRKIIAEDMAACVALQKLNEEKTKGE